MENVTENAPQSVESQIETQVTTTPPQVDEHQQAVDEAMQLFGIESKKEEPESIIEEEEAPPIEQPTEKKGITVKFNKEDTFIEEDKIPEYARKGLNYEKVESRAKEYQDALDRVAKQQGYKDHAELMANLDKIEQEKQQQQQDQFEQMKQKVIDDLVYNGVDEQAAREYAENNPLVKQARTAMEKEQIQEQERQQVEIAQTWQKSWDDLYAAFPELAAESKKFENGGRAEFYTPEMESMVKRGLTPKEAYTLLNMDKLQSQTRKQTEQKLIKEQRLGLRAQVEPDIKADIEPAVDPELESAFSMFGIPTKNAKKYAKK